MKISIIIPTLNRPEDLMDCLLAIKSNARQPDEIVIVEQGDVGKTKEVVQNAGVTADVIYLAEKSAAAARNMGANNTSGDLLCFIDDDVVVADDYFMVAEQYFLDSKNHSVLAIVGKDLVYAEKKKTLVGYLRQLFGVFFWRSAFTDYSRVLLSGHNVLRNTADNEQVIEWLSGASMVYRRQVFSEFSFDSRFIRWSFNEDMSLSHKVQLQYPNSLRYVPHLQYRHNESKVQRLLNEQIIKMSVIYRYIFWSEQVKQKSFFAPFAYVWSQVGFAVLSLLEHRSVRVVSVLVKSYWYLIKNHRKIKNETIDYNAFILKS